MLNELKNIIDSAILDESEIDRLIYMTKKQKVMQVHKSKISKGGGKDPRWFTRADGRKIVAPTEEKLVAKLYEIYFGDADAKTIKSFYPEWIKYKYQTSSRSTNVKRINSDFEKYYLDDPVSEEFVSIPLKKLTPYDIKFWASKLIKKNKLSKKQFGNIMVPLRQMLDLLVDKGELETNPARNMKLDGGLFYNAAVKPDAETQVFFKDELDKILEEAERLAEEYNDPTYYCIHLCVYTGIRPGECYALKYSDFNRKNNSLCIRRQLVEEKELLPDGSWGKSSYKISQYLKKNSKPRTIQIPDKVFGIVEKIRIIKPEKPGRDIEYLFDVKYPGNIDRKIYRICESFGMCRRSLNKLRKTYVSTLLNQGFDLDFVRKQAGHSNINTTLNNYTFATTRNEELIKKLNETL